MGLLKIIVIIIIALLALNYFAPETYDNITTSVKDKLKAEAQDYVIDQFLGREAALNMTQTLDDYQINYTITNESIVFDVPCETNEDCTAYVNMEGLTCSVNQTCTLTI